VTSAPPWPQGLTVSERLVWLFKPSLRNPL